MKFKLFSFFILLTLIFFSGCDKKEKIDSKDIAVQKEEKTETTKIDENKKLEYTFDLKKTDNQILTVVANENNWNFKGYENKVILLDFFATWCPPCKAEIPHLNSIREKYKDNFEIIGIEVGERDGTITDHDKLMSFMDEYQIKYPIVNGESNRNIFSAVSNLNRSGSIPFMILFTPKGEYVTHYVGMVPEEMLESDIKLALGK